MIDSPKIKTCNNPLNFKGEYIACGFCRSCRARIIADKSVKRLVILTDVQRPHLVRN